MKFFDAWQAPVKSKFIIKKNEGEVSQLKFLNNLSKKFREADINSYNEEK